MIASQVRRRRTRLMPLAVCYLQPAHPAQLRRLVLNYDDAEHCNQGEAPTPRIAYGVQFPDERIVLWHAHNGYVDWHRTLYMLHVCYVEHGNCHVEFLDSKT